MVIFLFNFVVEADACSLINSIMVYFFFHDRVQQRASFLRARTSLMPGSGTMFMASSACGDWRWHIGNKPTWTKIKQKPMNWNR